MIYVKRVYEPAERGDGARFLVDRLWPRGVKKEALRADHWIKEVSPSDGLRHWFRHDPARWKEFQHRYFAELDGKPEAWRPLVRAARVGEITLLFSARDTEHNNAVALRAYLTKNLPAKAHGRSGQHLARKIRLPSRCEDKGLIAPAGRMYSHNVTGLS